MNSLLLGSLNVILHPGGRLFIINLNSLKCWDWIFWIMNTVSRLYRKLHMYRGVGTIKIILLVFMQSHKVWFSGFTEEHALEEEPNDFPSDSSSQHLAPVSVYFILFYQMKDSVC